MLTFDGDALVISDSKGTPRHYAWRLLGVGGTFAVRLERLDTPGAVYTVRRQRYGWVCDCAAARWRSRWGPCKHVRCCRELEALVRRLARETGLPALQEIA